MHLSSKLMVKSCWHDDGKVGMCDHVHQLRGGGCLYQLCTLGRVHDEAGRMLDGDPTVLPIPLPLPPLVFLLMFPSHTSEGPSLCYHWAPLRSQGDELVWVVCHLEEVWSGCAHSVVCSDDVTRRLLTFDPAQIDGNPFCWGREIPFMLMVVVVVPV